MKKILNQLNLILKKAYFWQRLLVFSASLFLFSMFSRVSNDLFSTIFFFIAALSGVWLILSLFKKSDSQMIGKKPMKPFWVRLVAMVTLVPALVLLAPGLGFGLGLAMNPYTAEEIAANEARAAAEKVEREAREEAEKLEADEKAKRDELELAANELEEAKKKEEQRLANICDSPEVKESLKSQDELDNYDSRPLTDRENWFGWGFENPEVLLYPWCFEIYFVNEYEKQWEIKANWDKDPDYIYEAFGVQRKP